MLFPEIGIASRSDVSEMASIEKDSFPCPWGPEELAACISRGEPGPIRTWTALLSGRIVGYVTASIQSDGLHLLNLVVREPLRGKGIGSLLLQVAEDWGGRLGMPHVRLEVRPSAASARALYSSAGYSVSGREDRYYPDGEDALLMSRRLETDPTTASIARSIIQHCGAVPPVGVVLGSGLSWLAEMFTPGTVIPFREIPGFSHTELAGHPGEMLFSKCGRFVFLLGRRHGYQGYTGQEIVMLPGVLSDLGVSSWVLTSSSGAVDPNLRVGDAVMFRDHVNCAGNIPKAVYGRPGGMVYSGELIAMGTETAGETGAPVSTGIFACASGPSYETSAEIRFLREAGVSTVSMSTVPEALFLSSMGCDVAAISMVTNAASPGAKVTHDEVLEAQETVRLKQEKFLPAFLGKVADRELR